MRRAAHRAGARVGLKPALALGVLATVALAGCGGSAHRSGARDSNAPAPPPPAAVIVRPRHPAPSPALIRLRRAVRGALRTAGPAVGVYLYDLTDRRPLDALRAGVRRPPASVEKLYTTVAVLRLLGPGTKLQTAALGTGHLGRHGIWHGNLYLRGGGDPTFGDGRFNRVWEQGYGPTAAELAQALRLRGIRRVTGRVIGDGSRFSPQPGGPATGFAADIPDFGGQLGGLTYDHGSTSGALTPAAFAARQLARTLRSEHIGARASPLAGITPPGARPLASVSSPPMSVLLRLMDVPSDDLFAEMLTEELGARFAGGGSITRGAGVIAEQIALYGLHPSIVDGSGLSRADASSPLEVVTLLRQIWHTPLGTVLSESLPVVGISGTVSRIGRGTTAAGHCLAKTGTLNKVTNLAGLCVDRRRHTLAFAVFIDGPENWIAMPMLGRVVAALARY